MLGCDVIFGAKENRLYFPATMLSHASPHAEPELLDLHERFASEQVARLEKKDIVGQVERIVAELLDSGEVTLDAVAERLGIKPRTLRTRLTEAETSFNQVLADFRYRLARQLLAILRVKNRLNRFVQGVTEQAGSGAYPELLFRESTDMPDVIGQQLAAVYLQL